MTFLLVLLVTTALVFALKRPIKRWPLLFYGIAVALVALFIADSYVEIPRVIHQGLFVLVHKCTLATALFAIVMYLGVLPRSSKARGWLMPIRGELSVIAWILSLGHVVMYLMTYITMVARGLTNANTFIVQSLVVALVVFVLLMALGVTSFASVKRRMKARTWKRLQKLAYPFFVLVYVHLLLILLRPALLGGQAAQVSVIVYSVLFLGYIALRAYRAVQDRKEAQVVPAVAESAASLS